MSVASPVLLLQQRVGVLTYLVPDEVQPGEVVEVPLGNRKAIGVVWDAPIKGEKEGHSLPPEKLRAILRRLPLPPVRRPLRTLIRFVSDYYVSSPSAVLRMALPQVAFLGEGKKEAFYSFDKKRTSSHPARKNLLLKLGASGREEATTLSDWAKSTGTTLARLRPLVRDKTLFEVLPPPPPPLAIPLSDTHLGGAQKNAADTLKTATEASRFAPFLLEGVTGSGKTEVYLAAIESVIKSGLQALVLVPEIALTKAALERFARRFGFTPAVWHSGLTPAARRESFRAIAAGSAPIVVGARSALFLPFPKLGLIVVDEAHDAGFKQEDGVPYHGRDMAVMRAKFEKIPVVLATATPSVEVLEQVHRHTYQHLHLPDRHGGALLPDIHLVDMTKTPPPRGRWISPPLEEAISKRLEAHEQTLLFLNRRGFAPLTLCRTCGERLKCPNCTAWLVEHRASRTLQCHHCGYRIPTPKNCPSCGAEESLVPCGPGVERLAEEVATLWPTAHTAVATSDTLRTEGDLAHLIAAASSGETEILIGTQVLAKGHNFPNLTLVGVIDADLGLDGGDLRAAERSFQQIRQVAGRAGRAEKPGEALLQTYQPAARVMQALASGNSSHFIEAERAARLAARMPPFGRLAAIILSGENDEQVQEAGKILLAAAPQSPDISIFGPAPAPLAMLRRRYRYRLLLQATRSAPLQSFIRSWLGRTRLGKAIRLAVDIDPQSFL